MHHLHRSQAEEQDPLSPAAAPPKLHPRIFFWCVALVLGLLHVWAHRNDVSPDSISYIEIAWATARSGLQQIVNAYWSPLYPFLLSLVFRQFHPPVQWEFTAAHLLNFAVYLASLASFELFLEELILQRQAACESHEKSLHVSPRTVWIWGYVFFLWASYFWLGLAWVTPDLCVAVLVYPHCSASATWRKRRCFLWPSFFCSALSASAASRELLFAPRLSARCWRVQCLPGLRCHLSWRSRRRKDG